MRASKPFLLTMLLALMPCHPALGQTLPSGGTVVKGAATIQQNGASQTVTQTSQKAIINWQDFSIGKDGSVQFVQPNSSSVILNRVIGSNRSEIYGKLTANGQVFIVNPNGIYFGSGSSVDVGGLLATTLNIGDDDFMNGNYLFMRDSLSTARRDVINEGVLKARDKGYVVLAGDYAANRGIVQARLGTAALASGSKMTLDIQGDSLINFAVNEKTVAALSGVENSGQLLADGGRAIMTAAVATNLQTAVVNNSGVVRANTAEERNGEIILSADGGNTQVSGTLDASGTGAGQTGGTIQVLGNKVALVDNAVVNASGNAGGGKINIGGNFQGNGSLLNSQTAYVGQNVKIKADALNTGNGGDIIVWSNDLTRFYGNISAQGGAQSGDGGNVEVSGKAMLDYNGNVNTLARFGKAGNLLLDPSDIEILTSVTPATADMTATSPFQDATDNGGTSQMTVGALETALANGNVTIKTTTSTGSAPKGGTITIDDGGGGGVQWSSDHSLTLTADNQILFKSNVEGSSANSSMILNAANGAIQSSGTHLQAGSLLLTGGGSWDLAGVGSTNTVNSYNDFNVFAANLNGSLLRLGNNKNLTIGSVNGVNGISNVNGNTQLYLDRNNGAISITQAINSYYLYMRATGGVTQNASGLLTANQLGLGGGSVTLTQAGNHVGTLAASINGTLSYTDADTLAVGSVLGVTGITTSNHDVTIKTGNSSTYDKTKQPDASNPASLVLNESINAGNGNVRLTTGTGGIYQRHDNNSANGSITANQLLLKGDNVNSVTPFVLTNASNRVNTLAATANGSVSFAGAGNSSSTLTIGSIDGVNGITTTSNTVVSTTTNTDGTTTTSTNENNISLSIGGNLNIDKNLTASTATGTDTVSIGMGGDFTARTASGVKVLADTMGVFGDDMQGTFNITSNVANLAAAGGKVMVIDNSAYTGTLAGIGIGAAAANASATNGGSTVTVNSSDKPVGDFYLTTGGGLNIIKLNSKGQNLLLRSTSLSILLDATTADNARIMLQPIGLGSKIGINNSTESGFTPDVNYDADTLLKFSNPVSTFYFGTPSNAILNDAAVSSAAKNTFTGDIHIGYDGAFNLGYRSLSAQTSNNLVAYNVGPLYNLRLAAPNLTINSFNTFGDQIHLFSNNLQLPGTTANYINPYKPKITYRSLADQTIWVGHSYVANEPQILPSTLVKLPDGSTIIISGSSDYPFPNGGAGYGDIHIPWDDGIVLLGNRKLILSTGHKVYDYNATPIHTERSQDGNSDGGTSGGLWQGCQNLTTCAGTNPSPFPDPTPGGGGNTDGGDGNGGGNNSNGNNGGCAGCPPANPNTNPYPPDTTSTDNGNGNGNGSGGDDNAGTGGGDDGSGVDSGGDDNGKNGGGNNDDGSGKNDDGGGDGGGGTGSGGDGNGSGNDGSGDGGDGSGTGSGGNGNGDDGTGNGGGGDGSASTGSGGSGDGSAGNGDGSGNDGSGDGGNGSGNGANGNGDGSGDGGAGMDSGGAGDGSAGNGDGNGGDGAGDGGNGNGDGDGAGGSGNGDGGAGTGSGGNGDGSANSGDGSGGDGAGDGSNGNGNGANGNGDGNGDGGAGTGSGGTGDGSANNSNGNGGDGAGDGDGNNGNGNGDGNTGGGDGGAGTGSGGAGDGSAGNGDGNGDNGAGDNGNGNAGNGDGGDGLGNADQGNGTGSGGNDDGSGDAGAGTGSGGTGDGSGTGDSGNSGNGIGDGGNGSAGNGNGDGNGDGGDAGNGTASGGKADGSSDAGNGDGNGDGSGDAGAARAPAMDISCADVTESRKESRDASDKNGGKNLIEVKRAGLKLRDPCEQQPLQDGKSSKK